MPLADLAKDFIDAYWLVFIGGVVFLAFVWADWKIQSRRYRSRQRTDDDSEQFR